MRKWINTWMCQKGRREGFKGHRTLNLISCQLDSLSLSDLLMFWWREVNAHSDFKERLTGFVVFWKLTTTVCLVPRIVFCIFGFATFSQQHIFYLIIINAETCHHLRTNLFFFPVFVHIHSAKKRWRYIEWHSFPLSGEIFPSEADSHISRAIRLTILHALSLYDHLPSSVLCLDWPIETQKNQTHSHNFLQHRLMYREVIVICLSSLLYTD